MTWSIASWNVNSIAVRHPQVVAWLQSAQPTILAIQETKVPDEKFPQELWEPLGYHHYFHGQKTYNGVALLSKSPLMDVKILDIGEGQARVITGYYQDTLIVNVYVPNGAQVDSDKFAYKRRFLAQLQTYLASQKPAENPIIVLGDFNIAPFDIDVHDVAHWENSVLTCPTIRDDFNRLMDLGFTDTFQHHVSNSNDEDINRFSWWDYRQAAFRRNMGLRIDLILASSKLMPCNIAAHIDKAPRSNERPSDHTPVVATFRNGDT